MKRNFGISLIAVLITLVVPLNAVWRLGKPRKNTPSLSNINTYTLSPITTHPQQNGPLLVRTVTKAIQHKKKLATASITVLEKTSKETDRIKYIKGYTTLTQGIPTISSSFITIACRGYARKKNPKVGLPQQGGGIVDAYARLRHNIAFTPIVSFDFPDDRRSFNFGQALDQECLEIVYQETVAKNPNAKICLSGDCRGSLNALRFATTNPQNLDSLVLLSPFVSATDLTQELAKNYLNKYMGKNSKVTLHNFFQWWFPNYDPAQDHLVDDLHKINGKKIIIVHRVKDALIADETVKALASNLSKNNTVYLVMINDNSANHSKLMGVYECQTILNAFYEKYTMPCDQLLAKAGKEQLNKALI